MKKGTKLTKKQKERMRKSALERWKHGEEIPWNKGLTKKTDKRILKQSLKSAGRKLTTEHRNSIRLSHLGKKHSKEWNNNIGKGHIGNKWSPELRVKLSGDRHSRWKGEKAGYRSKHIWMETNYGKPSTCEHCKKTDLHGHEIHWANISGEYKRDRIDWIRLCVKCHKKLDKKC